MSKVIHFPVVEGDMGAIGKLGWMYINITAEHVKLHWEDVHLRLMPFERIGDPEESVLCVAARGEGFKQGGSWTVTDEKEIVNCQDCIELIHS